MRNQTVIALLFVAVLAVLTADFTVGCGQGYVHGQVTQKYTGGQGTYLIAVNGKPYAVPQTFYDSVQVGEMVRFDGKEWSVEKPGQPSPNVPLSQ